MKKNLLLIIIQLIGFVNVFAQKTYHRVNANDVLTKAGQYVKHIKTLSYNSSYRQVNSGEDDSIYTANSKVWLQALPADSIFSAKFHMAGETKTGGAYDYFYDGINSYEINHNSKEIRLTNPRLFANDEHNPAKARTTMLPFNYDYTDVNLKKHLLTNQPVLSMQVQPKQYVVRLDYPLDKLGSKQTRILYINKQSFAIERIAWFSTWRGAHYSTDAKYTDIVLNDPATLQHVPVTQSYQGYSINEKKPDIITAPVVSKLIGTVAPQFVYNTFDNKKIALTSLKGKYVLLDFWESWCGNCIMAMPDMRKINDTYAAKGLAVLSVTTESPSKIKELIKINNLDYPALIADKKILHDYEIYGRPTYVLIDPAGKIIALNEGDLDGISKQLSKILN